MRIDPLHSSNYHNQRLNDPYPLPNPPTQINKDTVFTYTQEMILWVQHHTNHSSTYDTTSNFDNYSAQQIVQEIQKLGLQASQTDNPNDLSQIMNATRNTIQPYLNPESSNRFQADTCALKAVNFTTNFESQTNALQPEIDTYTQRIQSAKSQIVKYQSSSPALASQASSLLDSASNSINTVTGLLKILKNKFSNYEDILKNIQDLIPSVDNDPSALSKIQDYIKQIPDEDTDLKSATDTMSSAISNINQSCDILLQMRQQAGKAPSPTPGSGQGQMYIDTNYIATAFQNHSTDPTTYFNNWFTNLKNSGFSSVDLSFAQMNDIGINPNIPAPPSSPVNPYINIDDGKTYLNKALNWVNKFYQGDDQLTLSSNIQQQITNLGQYPGEYEVTQACDSVNNLLYTRQDKSSTPPVEPPVEPPKGQTTYDQVNNWISQMESWVDNNPNFSPDQINQINQQIDSIKKTINSSSSQTDLTNAVNTISALVPSSTIDSSDTFMSWLNQNPDQFKQFVELAHKNGVKIDLSFGGANADSAEFKLPQDPVTSANKLHDFMVENGIDSVDFDIEHGFPTDETSSNNFRTFFTTLHSLCQSTQQSVLLTSMGGVGDNAQGMLKALFTDDKGAPCFNNMFDGLNLMLYSDTDYYIKAKNDTYGIESWMDIIGAKTDPSIASKIHIGFDDGVNYENGSQDGVNTPIGAGSNGQAAAMRYEALLNDLKNDGYSTNLGGILVWPDLGKNPYDSGLPNTSFENDFQNEMNRWNTLNN